MAKLKNLLGPDVFIAEDRWNEEEVQIEDLGEDMDEMEPINRNHGLKGIKMVELDDYGLPIDGYDYYQHIVVDPAGEYAEAIEQETQVEIIPDMDLKPEEMDGNEYEVFESMMHEAEDYEELDDDFVLQAMVSGSEDEEAPEQVNDADFQDAMDEFICEHPEYFSDDDQPDQAKVELPEGLTLMKKAAPQMPQNIPLADDHVAVAAANAPDEDTPSEEESEDESDQWDVETILSTYTNTDNRPHIVRVKRERKPKTQNAAVEPDEEEDDYLPAQKTQFKRAKNETAEEKKARKDAAKNEKRQRKQAKKEMKVKYSQEMMK